MVRIAALAAVVLPTVRAGQLQAGNLLDARNEASQSLASFSELGCYGDSIRSRVFDGYAEKGVDHLTETYCAGKCADYPFYGLQFAHECWCGDYTSDYDRYGTSDSCNMDCSGDDHANCGGREAMRIFTQAATDDDSIGCYADSTRRVFSNKLVDTSGMEPSVCRSHCQELGMYYYGTQWGEECWCGAEGTEYDALGSATCDRPCSGDPTKYCGGTYAMTVYNVEGESNCYADDKSARVGYRQIKDGHMTHELCTAHCEDLGAAWALPQYGHECFCADSDTDLDQYGPATCDYECEGNSDQICGGRNAFTVIPLDGSSATITTPTNSSPTPVMPIPACDSLSAIRYAAGSGVNGRMYLEGGGCGTMTDMYKTRVESDGWTPKGPIYILDDDNNKVLAPTEFTGKWLIESELFVREGSVFYCVSTAELGDCDELRIQSTDDYFHEIRGHGGSLYFKDTLVTSWDTDTGAVRTEYENGRSFLNCVSEYESNETCDGEPKNDFGECRMDIIDSEMGWMGYFDSESYGLTWKVRGFCTDKSNPEVFDNTNVYGDILRSNIHHMYYGMYSYGHQGGVWTDNQMHDNHQYGFDPHDDSDYLTIARNTVYNNVNHGIIASKRCNNVEIYDNEVYDGGENAAGIFLHRSSDNCKVYGNHVHDMQDAGMAMLESFDASIYENKFENVKYGIRISLGGGDNVVSDNDFINCSQYGLYTYMGSDEPEMTEDGRPGNNRFVGNRITDTVQGVKIKEADDTTISGNTFTGTVELEFSDATGTMWSDNSLPDGVCINEVGTASYDSSSSGLPDAKC